MDVVFSLCNLYVKYFCRENVIDFNAGNALREEEKKFFFEVMLLQYEQFSLARGALIEITSYNCMQCTIAIIFFALLNTWFHFLIHFTPTITLCSY